MAKIVDSFLFFQELDLLEIRLEYLYDKVDNFIILEACQTFTGKSKPFNFEDNKQRFEKYLDKIIYFKIEDSHDSYSSVINYLKSKRDPSYDKVFNILESHTHYPKDGLNWVLDTYHRELLHIAYSQYLEDEDIIFLSDLDEIPSYLIFEDPDLYNISRPLVCQQHEFMYFLNYYNNSDWLGTIYGPYSFIKQHSLSDLRIDSKRLRNIVQKNAYVNGGYHFTTMGNLESIKRKIESWGHQEFNTKGVIQRLEYNIKTGQDIFERTYGTQMKKVELIDHSIFDKKMASIISKYIDLIREENVIYVSRYSLYNLYRKFNAKLKNLLIRLFKEKNG